MRQRLLCPSLWSVEWTPQSAVLNPERSELLAACARVVLVRSSHPTQLLSAMATRSRAWLSLLLALALALALSARAEEAAAPEEETVLALDADNFDEVVTKHKFVVVEFYAPWCGSCQKLVPAYEKAAQALIKHDPPVVLAKADAVDEKNKALAARYGVRVYPTIKIFKNYGENIQEYKGPRDDEGIVQYVKKHIGPPSTEIKSPEDAAALIDDNKIYIAGIFKEFSGAEFANFMEAAENLRSDYEFGHTLHANLLPRGDAAAEGPLVRLLKPFDELVVDSKDFDVDAIEKFIYDASIPKVVSFDNNPDNGPYLLKYFKSSAPKAMVFVNFSAGPVDSFKSALYAATEEFNDKEIRFLIGDSDTDGGKGILKFFGVKTDQAPLIALQHGNSKKFFKDHIEPDQIISWLKDYFDGKLKPFMRSQPIPEVNNEPVKVVVADSIQDVVFKSGKNVLIEFYAPWCKHCKELAPILEEAATTLQSDEEVVIAKIDATENDAPSEFEVQGYPTLYFVTPSRKVTSYDGGRTLDEIVDFVKKNKETTASEKEADPAATEAYVKDEL